MTVYFKNGGLSWPMLAHEEIGHYSARASLSNDEQVEALVHLGIEPTDEQALTTMKQLLQVIRTEEIKVATLRPDITSSWNADEEDATGIYFIEDREQQNIAVFKVGRKRACLELVARKIAHLLGLADTVICGTFAVLQDAPKLETSGISEQLWCDKEKLYVEKERNLSSDSLLMLETSTSKKAPTDWFSLALAEEESPMTTPRARSVVGVLQPYLPQPAEKASCFEFLCMNITALAIGLRDGKNDGFRKATLIDVEDCMPVRFDPEDEPEWQKKVACTYLPYLDQDERTTKPITSENLTALKLLVTAWDIERIVEQVKEQKIVFEDQTAETMDAPGLDEGGYSFRIQEKYEPHPINGILDRMAQDEKLIFSDQQIAAFKKRLTKIKDYITDQSAPFTVQDLVFAVDSSAKKFFDLLEESKKRASPAIGKKNTLSRSGAECARDSLGPFHLIGQHLPKEFA